MINRKCGRGFVSEQGGQGVHTDGLGTVHRDNAPNTVTLRVIGSRRITSSNAGNGVHQRLALNTLPNPTGLSAQGIEIT